MPVIAIPIPQGPGFDLDALTGFLTQSARDANAKYSPEDLQGAVRTILNHFIRATRCTMRTDMVNVITQNNTFGFSNELFPGFRPERFIDARIVEKAGISVGAGQFTPLRVVDLAELNEAGARRGKASGAPTMMAFRTPTQAILFPTPDIGYGIDVRWWPPLTDFSGAGVPGQMVLNVPDDMAEYVVRTGGVCLLQFNEIANVPIADKAWQQYLAYIAQCTRAGSYGVKSFRRQTLRDSSCE